MHGLLLLLLLLLLFSHFLSPYQADASAETPASSLQTTRAPSYYKSQSEEGDDDGTTDNGTDTQRSLRRRKIGDDRFRKNSSCWASRTCTGQKKASSPAPLVALSCFTCIENRSEENVCVCVRARVFWCFLFNLRFRAFVASEQGIHNRTGEGLISGRMWRRSA
jgi:hypothetical protein